MGGGYQDIIEESKKSGEHRWGAVVVESCRAIKVSNSTMERRENVFAPQKPSAQPKSKEMNPMAMPEVFLPTKIVVKESIHGQVQLLKFLDFNLQDRVSFLDVQFDLYEKLLLAKEGQIFSALLQH